MDHETRQEHQTRKLYVEEVQEESRKVLTCPVVITEHRKVKSSNTKFQTQETILPYLKSSDSKSPPTFLPTTKSKRNVFLPQRSNKHFRAIFQNLNTLKLHHDGEVQQSLQNIKSHKGDLILMQEVNINLHTYTNKRKMEYLSRKRSLNYRFNYVIGGQDITTSNLKGGLMTIHQPSTELHISNDKFYRWQEVSLIIEKKQVIVMNIYIPHRNLSTH